METVSGKSLIDPKVEAWWNEVKQGVDKVSKNPPDLKLDPLEYQAILGGYKRAEEFNKDYLKRATLAMGGLFDEIEKQLSH